MITYRLMEKKDLDSVAILENITFSQPWSKKSLNDFRKQSNTVFMVAEEAKKIVGYVGMYKVLNEGNVTNIAILPKYRGIGVGERLMKELFVEAKKIGVKSITLEVRESNIPAISLYKKLGFDTVGLRKNFYEKPTENAVIMWKYSI